LFGVGRIAVALQGRAIGLLIYSGGSAVRLRLSGAGGFAAE
jgi:hypothetical protein